MVVHMKRFVRWFVICGGVGVLVAVALYLLGSMHAVRTSGFFNPYVIFVLAPAMILGLAEPTSIGSKLSLLGIVLGTNFVLYGLLGLLLRGAWSWFPHGTTRAAELPK
jgi:hypothetical protein